MAMDFNSHDMASRISAFRSALSSFAASPSTFRIVSSTSKSATPPRTVYVLDSSFNPPTIAHLQIATSALSHDKGLEPKRLLLLLATQNADKAPKPASFEQRLVMMELFSQDLIKLVKQDKALESTDTVVDIGLTKLPYFSDKARSIDEAKVYENEPQQVHLTGFDTLIRIFNPKYYDENSLSSLQPFLSRHRLCVTYRVDDSWGGKAEQDEYLETLRSGGREDEGGKREWAERIDLVEGSETIISSTKVREACKQGDRDALSKLVTKGVADFALTEQLYLGD